MIRLKAVDCKSPTPDALCLSIQGASRVKKKTTLLGTSILTRGLLLRCEDMFEKVKTH